MAQRIRIAAPNARGGLGELRRIAPDIKAAAGEALREAARDTIQGLQQVGPAYSGRFRDSWQTEVEGRGRKVCFKTGIARFQDNDFGRGKDPAILIGNSAPYAQEAMDLIPGKFISQEEGPVKDPVAVGRRFGRFRGDVKELSNDDIVDRLANSATAGVAISTAEPDWYSTFMDAGRFGKAFRQGAGRGFGKAAKRGRK
jgi:hypothetical protein